GHALDGCAVCGCHHNIHRRDNNSNLHSFCHSPPPLLPPPTRREHNTSWPSSLSPRPSSPPLISLHFPPYYAVPHMILSLGNCPRQRTKPKMEKRYRTKFSQEKKEKMHGLCEKFGRRMNKEDERLIQEFCNEVGVSRRVFKVWMHNNKNIFKERSFEGTNITCPIRCLAPVPHQLECYYINKK
ncbi:hypothetical protein Lal_00018397, partial [Lupinus albus]